MQYDFSKLKKELANIEAWLGRELGAIRTNRANPSILDSVRVEAYGSDMAIKEVAGMANEDPRTIRISPWDQSLVKAIEKSITVANLGVSVSVDDKGIRVSFPELTSERRTEIVKLAKEKFEDSRIQIRKRRDEANAAIAADEKKGGMGEDDAFRFKAEAQKLVDDTSKKLADMMEKKEKEILS
ncbi:MAG: ribosome recycling factor [Patescibacteria group bacterium]|nr:ribosome recycling factor [Patescibacteria group bacterium]MDE2116394.1 ribosome recycling factor [Patescibacteria group bacterium]